jgi:hypothetical protein
LSICIPAFNMEPWIGGAVSSALSLGHADEVEVVVVDNCSTDGTQHVLASLDPAPNLRLIRAEDHVDTISNFNRSVRASTGSWVTVLGADDELFAEYYANLRPCLDRTDTVAFAQVARMQWDDHETLFGLTEPHTLELSQFVEMLGGAACISTTAFRRDLFDEVGGFDASVGTVFDFDFLYRISARAGLPIRGLGVAGGRYYPLRGSTWTSQEQSSEAAELLLAWIRLRAADLGSETTRRARRALAARSRHSARAQLAAGQRDAARRSFTVAAACTDGREHWKNRAARAATHLPAGLARSALVAYTRIRRTNEFSPT